MTNKTTRLKITILNIIVAFSLNAQDKYNPAVLERNHITTMEGYLFEGNSKTDSFLITKEYFNPKGRRTKIEIYDTVGLRSEYIYIYKDDTLRIERITKFGGKFSSRTKIFYDKRNREIKAVDYNLNNKKTGTHSKTKYNDLKLTEETKIYFSNKLAIHTKRKFDKNKVLKEYLVKKDGRWIKQGLSTDYSKTEIENYQGTGLLLERVEQTVDQNKTILGIMGKLDLKAGDVLITEKYINQNGLLEYEKQYLNNNLLAVKKYKYVP